VKDVVFNRVWSMPSGDTFSIPPIGDFVRRWLVGRAEIVDPFARNSRFANYRNDLNPNTTAEHHLQADEFLASLRRASVSVDAVLIDPPYSPRQISRLYKEIGIEVSQKDTQDAAFMRRVYDAAHKITRPGSIVLSFGWNSAGMGKGRGYEIREILLVNHGGRHNDTICLAEERIANIQDELPI
jgi:hypothetical protein